MCGISEAGGPEGPPLRTTGPEGPLLHTGLANPLVSVILPVRNGMPFVQEAVASILGQTYRHFELIIVDDGSTDGTRAWVDGLGDSRVRVMESRGRGIVAALNTGLDEARGELIARHDADDRSRPGRFDAQVGFLNAHSCVDVVATWADFIDEHGRTVTSPWVTDVRRLHDTACSPEALRRLLPLTCGLVHGSVMARTAVLRGAGGYRDRFEWAEDYDLWLRLLARHRFAKLPARLYAHRLHRQQVRAERRDLQLRRTIAAKVEFIARTYPAAGRGTRVLVQGEGRGATAYRQAAAQAGWALADSEASLVVVTDLQQLVEQRATLTPPQWRWEGNIAIRDS